MSRSYADMVADALRDDSTPPPRFPSDRQKLVGAVERGLRARQRRQQMVRWSLSASAAAAVLVLVIGGKTLLTPYAPVGPLPGKTLSAGLHILPSSGTHGRGAVIPGNGVAAVPAEEGMPLIKGFRVVAPASDEVHIGAARGTTLALESGGDVVIGDASTVQRYELKTGAIRARVAKLMAGERFVIATSDAEVEVHGTAFRVAVVAADPGCGGGTITRVSVTEGVVSVRRGDTEVRITPGHVWPESCEEKSASASAPPVAPAAGGARVRARSTMTARTGARGVQASAAVAAAAAASEAVTEVAPEAPAATPIEVVKPAVTFTRSQLAEQNDLFASAVHAKRRGQGSQAVRIFDRLMRDYPSSPLAESAAVQRMKLLSVIDSVASRRAASEYLARYPGGFARVDAHHIVDQP